MGIKPGTPLEVRKERRMCCCPRQPHLSPEDTDRLLKDKSIQLCNLSHTYAADIEGEEIYRIREMFQQSSVPFRYKGCPRNMLTCCGSCTRTCTSRCPQDVVNRANLFCGNILYAMDVETRERRYKESPKSVQLLYEELIADNPRYDMVASMVTEMISPHYNKQLEKIIEEVYNNENSPYKFDYAPTIEHEEILSVHTDGSTSVRYRKRVDPKTGDAIVYDWPRSGMCPYCLPEGMVDRRRITGDKNRRKGKQVR